MSHPPQQVESLMREFEPDWFIAGGWAIDLFLGCTTRPHDDVEIAIFRPDQIALQKYLNTWRLQKAVDGKLSDWTPGKYLELPVHAIHCFNETAELPFLEVLLNEREDNNWRYRRNRQIRKPIPELFLLSNSSLKFVCVPKWFCFINRKIRELRMNRILKMC